MRELTYTILDLEKGSKKTCDFCSNLYGEDNKSVNQIITRIKANGKYVSDRVVCEECKEKFENNELLKCERCGRLQTKSDFDFCSHKYVCDCVRYNENLEEKAIAEETIEMEREMHEASLKATNRWYTEYQNADKADLLKRVVELEEEKEQLKERNQKLVPEDLANKIAVYEKEITELKERVEQLTNQQKAQIETPPKDKGLKGLFKFGGKK